MPSPNDHRRQHDSYDFDPRVLTEDARFPRPGSWPPNRKNLSVGSTRGYLDRRGGMQDKDWPELGYSRARLATPPTERGRSGPRLQITPPQASPVDEKGTY